MNNKEIFFNILIFIGFFLFIISTALILSEFYEAKSFCSQEKGTYSFNFTEAKHYCSNKTISRYSDGWDFDSYRQFSGNITLPD